MGCSQQKSQIESIYSKNVLSEEDEKKYPLFQKNFWFEYIQNVNKIYIEKLIDSKGNHFIITHKIYMTLDYKNQRMGIIQIEKKRLCESELNDFFNLRIEIVKGCSFEYLRNYIEKYNEKFKIDSTKWFNINKTTDIIIKVEKTDSGIKGFEMMYDKKASTLNYHKIENPGQNTVYKNECINNLNSLRMIEKYNKLNSDLVYEISEEKVEYDSYLRECISETKKEANNNVKDEDENKIDKRIGEMRKAANERKKTREFQDRNIVDEKKRNILKVEENGTIKDTGENFLEKVENKNVIECDRHINRDFEGSNKAQVANNFFANKRRNFNDN